MRFAFTEDQLGFRDAVRSMLDKECPAEVVRAAWPDDGTGAGARAEPAAVAAVWARLADIGVLGVAVPEAAGGLGLAELDWVLLAEEAGYAAVPHPFVETVAVAAPLLASAGAPTGGGRSLAGIVGGTVRIAAALTPGHDGRAVPYAARADGVLVHARSTGAVHLLGPDEAGVHSVRTVDGAIDAADLTDRRCHDGNVVTAAPALVDQAFDRGALGAAAQLLGLARHMLDLTVGYVVERRQFGVPVGSFQAVKHHLADALVHLELARPAVHRAAYSAAVGSPNRARDVSMAKAMASDAARLVGAKALQCHGAIGYTVEYDLHLYLKRAWALAATWGTAAWHRDRVGRAMGI